MCVSGGSHQGYKLGEEVQGDYGMQRLIKHDKTDVGSPLLEAAPVQVFDHSGNRSITIFCHSLSLSAVHLCPSEISLDTIPPS